MALFERKKFSSLFSGFLTFWEHKSQFQRLESRLNDSAPFFWISKKSKILTVVITQSSLKTPGEEKES
jgi:hypothetical protein